MQLETQSLLFSTRGDVQDLQVVLSLQVVQTPRQAAHTVLDVAVQGVDTYCEPEQVEQAWQVGLVVPPLRQEPDR